MSACLQSPRARSRFARRLRLTLLLSIKVLRSHFMMGGAQPRNMKM